MKYTNIEDVKENVLELLENKKFAEIKPLINDLNPADIAVLFGSVDQAEVPILFRLLNKETAAETFSYMETDKQKDLITAFSDFELRVVIENLFMDDTVDIIEEMPANVVNKILRIITPERRKQINELLNYPDDSAGSIMTTEYIALKKDLTVEEAFKKIKKEGVNKETIYTCYVIENRKLIGTVTVKDLLLAEGDEKIEDIMKSHLIFVTTHEDQEKVANMFNKYDLLALPVVDKEERLVGIITVDDAMQVLQEESTEDIEAMAAILPSDKSYMKTGVIETWKKRIPWLLLLMISATFTGKIIGHYEEALGSLTILTAFIPMLMDTGGNAGSQSSVTIIRSLSMDEIRFKDIFKVIWKELRVAFLCAATLFAATLAKILIVDTRRIDIALVVATTLAFAVVVAKFIGCTLPIIVKKLGFDPAVMVSPFITTLVDALSLIIYFSIAVNFLPEL